MNIAKSSVCGVSNVSPTPSLRRTGVLRSGPLAAIFAGLLAALLPAAAEGQGTYGRWTADAGDNWGAASRWASGIIPDGIDHIADFSTVNITGTRTVTVDEDRTIGWLLFGDASTSSHGWNLNAAAGKKLTLDVSGGLPVILVREQSLTINAPLYGDDGLAKLFGNTLTLANTLNLSGPIYLGGGATVLSAADARLTGATALNLAGGTLELNNAANYQNNRLPDALAVGLHGGTLALIGRSAVTVQETVGATTFSGGATLRVDPAGLTELTLADLLRAGTAATINFAHASGTLGGTGNDPAIFVTAWDATLPSGYDTFIGGWATVNGSDFARYTPVTAGVEALGYAGRPSDINSSGHVVATAAQTLAANNSLDSLVLSHSGTGTVGANLGGGTLNLLSGGLIRTSASAATANTATISNGVLTAGGSAAADLYLFVQNPSSGNNVLAVTANIADNAGGAVRLVKSGGGHLTLTGAKTYSGGTVMHGGTLNVHTVQGALGTGDLFVDGGTVFLRADTGSTFTKDGTNRYNVTLAGNAAFQAGRITTASGGITHSLGTLTVANPHGLPFLVLTHEDGDGFSGSDDNGSITFQGATIQDNLATLVVNADADRGNGSGTITLAGINAAVGVDKSMKLVKMGDGAMEITAASNYEGGTFLYAGNKNRSTLRVRDANGLGTGGLTMYAGTTFVPRNDTSTTFKAGTPNLPVTIWDNATISPSRVNSGGTVTHTLGNLTIAAPLTLTLAHGSNFNSNTTGSLNVGSITLHGNLTLAVNLTNGTGVGRLTNTGAITEVGGPRSITRTGGGEWHANSAASTYSGGTALNGGLTIVTVNTTVDGGGNITQGPFGTGTLTMGGGALRAGQNANQSTLANPLVITADSSFGNTGASDNGTITFTSPVTLQGGNRTVNVRAPNATVKPVIFVAAVGEDAPGRALTKSGVGILELRAANTYTGGTTVSEGTLLFTYGGASPVLAGGAVNVGKGATLQIAPGAGNTADFSQPTSFMSQGVLHVVSGVADWGATYLASDLALATMQQSVSPLDGRFYRPGDVGLSDFRTAATANPLIFFENATTFLNHPNVRAQAQLSVGKSLLFSGATYLSEFGQTGSQEDVGGAWAGTITVGSPGGVPAGWVSFATNSDDGSTVYVDLNQDGIFQASERVVDNSGSHGTQVRSGAVNLAAGTYNVAIGYFNGSGATQALNIEVRWSPGGAAGAPVSWSEMKTLSPQATGTQGFVGSTVRIDAGAQLNAGGLQAGVLQMNGTASSAATLVLGDSLAAVDSFADQLTLAGTTPLGTLNLGNQQRLTVNQLSIATGGTLTKSGPGALRIEGAGTGAGTLHVAAGSLGGSGSIAAAVLLGGGATLAPGSSPGTLTVAALTLENGSLLDFELGSLAGPNDLLAVTGSLVLPGGTDAAVINILDDGGLEPGTYTLITYGALSGGSVGTNLVLGSTPAGPLSFTLLDNPSGSSIDLVVVPEPTALALLALGIAGAGLLCRRRRPGSRSR